MSEAIISFLIAEKFEIGVVPTFCKFNYSGNPICSLQGLSLDNRRLCVNQGKYEHRSLWICELLYYLEIRESIYKLHSSVSLTKTLYFVSRNKRI